MDIRPNEAVGAVVGATGAIGKVCAQLLAPDMAEMLLMGRSIDRLNDVKYRLEQAGQPRVSVSTNMTDLKRADVIITVSNTIDAIIRPHHLKSGAVVCDVARPRDVSRRVVEERNDVLVIEGGMVEVPGKVNFNFNFGFPPGMAFACMAETMILALEERYENYSLGKQISLDKVVEIAGLAKKHGFRLGGFRSFEKAVTPQAIAKIKSNVIQDR
jgi:predicted amino acid dehydrogenase